MAPALRTLGSRLSALGLLLLVGAAPDAGLLVSDFDDGTLRACSGQDWAPSSDLLVGGASTAALAIVDGERGHGKALHVMATVVLTARTRTRWAGALLLPGASPLEAKDLSRYKGVAFRVRGDADDRRRPAGPERAAGDEYALHLYTQHRGGAPSRVTFTAGKEWREVYVPFASFGEGIDGSDVTGLLVGRDVAGAFTLDLDEVRWR